MQAPNLFPQSCPSDKPLQKLCPNSLKRLCSLPKPFLVIFMRSDSLIAALLWMILSWKCATFLISCSSEHTSPRSALGILAKSLKTSTTTTATPWQFIPLAGLGEWIHPLFSWHLNTSKRAKRSAHLTVQCFNQLGVLMVMIFSKAESLKWHCYTNMTTGELAGNELLVKPRLT